MGYFQSPCTFVVRSISWCVACRMCMVSLDRCGLGCSLGSMHCDMWRHSLLHCIDMILHITILVSVMLCVVHVVLPWLWKQSSLLTVSTCRVLTPNKENKKSCISLVFIWLVRFPIIASHYYLNYHFLHLKNYRAM